MRQFIEGFNQQVLLKLGFGPEEALILQWFKSFSLSDRQKYIGRGAERYYWVKYSKVISDLPCLFIANPKKIGKIFCQLSGEGREHPEQWPLKKLRANVKGVQEVYFKFNAKVLKQLEGGEDMSDFTDELGVKPKQKEKNRRSKKLDPNVLTILQELKQLGIKEGKSLFSFTLPTDPYVYTKSIQSFANKLNAIYEGRFKHDYKIDPSFLERNEYYVGEDNRQKLMGCIGNWGHILNVVFQAARRYARWFSSENEPQKKEWLTRDVSAWIYSEHSQQSLFYLCLVTDPTPIREVSAKKYYDKLPADILEIAELFKLDKWDGYSYWKRIHSVVEWYDKYAEKLMHADTNTISWFEGSQLIWFDGYIRWLTDELSDGGELIWLSNIGTGCATWELWLSWAKKEHNIEIQLPEK